MFFIAGIFDIFLLSFVFKDEEFDRTVAAGTSEAGKSEESSDKSVKAYASEVRKTIETADIVVEVGSKFRSCNLVEKSFFSFFVCLFVYFIFFTSGPVMRSLFLISLLKPFNLVRNCNFWSWTLVIHWAADVEMLKNL